MLKLCKIGLSFVQAPRLPLPRPGTSRISLAPQTTFFLVSDHVI
jgi:hypothetical protein